MVHIEKISLESKGRMPTYSNISEQIRQAIKNSGINNGICCVISPHTTCSVFFEEFAHDINEDGLETLQEDLNNILSKIIPNHDSDKIYKYPGPAHYDAVESWPNASEYLPNGDRKALWNGDAHLKSSILGSSETFLVENGSLGVGSTGHIYFVDFDITRPRTRHCNIVVLGE